MRVASHARGFASCSRCRPTQSYILLKRKYRQNTQQYFPSLVQSPKFLAVNSYTRLTQDVRHCYSNFVFSKFLEALKPLAQMRSISGNLHSLITTPNIYRETTSLIIYFI